MDILVVEDNDTVRQMLTEVLEDEGYQVVAAAHGREALILLQTSDVLPRVILLDLDMPVMNGWQFLATQHQDAALEHLPVIIISAGYLEREVGMWPTLQLLPKPIDINELILLVATYESSCCT